ncbi:MAG: AAA family ATPase [Candidatus Omnitrophica bacterium]|nr:AAA family ATPase [Candidatus Omnitrophota bacterium]
MSYFSQLGLTQEPFSTSPDPEFLYHSLGHETALRRLEISIRLRRGLSLIVGDIGTGKTTLSRTLFQVFKNEPDFIFHLILDPNYKTEFQFLSSLIKMLGIHPNFKSTLDYKESLKDYLFAKGVEENKTIILLIDEGQKLTPDHLEILRSLLNYETNEYKLLQLVIMSQMELLPRLRRAKNFTDRIALKYIINPLGENETKQMIEFRLHQAGFDKGASLFSEEAMRLIYEYTQGYPRKITLLCHDALELLIMKEKRIVDRGIVEEIINRESFLNG